MGAVPALARRALLCLCFAVSLASAVLLTIDLVYESRRLPPKWLLLREAEGLGVPHLSDALERFAGSDR